jgi:hypothetical protein
VQDILYSLREDVKQEMESFRTGMCTAGLRVYVRQKLSGPINNFIIRSLFPSLVA